MIPSELERSVNLGTVCGFFYINDSYEKLNWKSWLQNESANVLKNPYIWLKINTRDTVERMVVCWLRISKILVLSDSHLYRERVGGVVYCEEKRYSILSLGPETPIDTRLVFLIFLHYFPLLKSIREVEERSSFHQAHWVSCWEIRNRTERKTKLEKGSNGKMREILEIGDGICNNNIIFLNVYMLKIDKMNVFMRAWQSSPLNPLK